MLGQSHGQDADDESFTLIRFQTRPMRHAIHDPRPIFGVVTPKRWQCVAFDA
jgi:hypothetical protein